ncbi:hypothetical protein [Mucilaginibacter glaciei]|uniref:Uncharacterized protein n=1 Tax=Mucilaginibacter glaciei TaxID=2772109 RepID=A0A926S365_9SPHI|nr:hypothetical protein [Mucilaginibacter glaciei]MBD1394602.1 hypothetical protein [Mucilaginibacter glaciei]
MKQFLLVLFLCTALQAKSQSTKPITSFLGVKFGSTPAQVIAGLKAKGAVFIKASSKADFLIFDNIKLGGRKTTHSFVSFSNGKAAQAGFIFKAELEAKTLDYYNDLVADIAGVYGEGTVTKEFKPPYEDGDGYEVTAISTGKADFKTLWGLEDEQQPGSVMVIITDNLSIMLTYQDKSLMALKSQQDKKKSNADF